MSDWGTNGRFEIQQRTQMATDARRTREAAEESNKGRVHLWIVTYISLGVAVCTVLACHSAICAPTHPLLEG
ncbi:hypothetical protein E3T43_07055 [Cryobacterium sp. Hh7]|uniref:hypothetical protein n=1 Tax=Cryobacterium sp. Hh7 TaxID=1259159 RepID=UPI00106D8721|nr:hypothetical protein [Cryobacterium sp. Hh7]TFD58000.1 hypothetical protein E3T43_07055 [Cryobacterium sp. Hh7]